MALNIIGKEKELILAGFGEIRDTAFETGELEAEARQLNGEINVAAEPIQNVSGKTPASHRTRANTPNGMMPWWSSLKRRKHGWRKCRRPSRRNRRSEK